MNTETWISTEGRRYQVKRDDSTPEKVKADLIARGFDGFCYDAESLPVGRQKKIKYAILYRMQNGRFTFVYGF